MGINGSKNQYSFNDHYYIVEDSFPADSFYRLQSKITDQHFIGRQVQCLDKQDAYQMECTIHQKLTNPSPFVTKLLSAESNQQKSYCQTHKKYHLLYRQITKVLGQEIEQRTMKRMPFSAQQISAVIVRIAKGLKYLYQIGHYHGNVSANSITWPVYNHESIQLIDQWSLKNQNRALNSLEHHKQSNSINSRKNQQSEDLYALGLVAKKMMDISPNISAQNPSISEALKHKIFVLLSQNPMDRIYIYNIFNSWDRELENKPVINTVQYNENKLNNQLRNTHNNNQVTKVASNNWAFENTANLQNLNQISHKTIITQGQTQTKNYVNNYTQNTQTIQNGKMNLSRPIQQNININGINQYPSNSYNNNNLSSTTNSNIKLNGVNIHSQPGSNYGSVINLPLSSQKNFSNSNGITFGSTTRNNLTINNATAKVGFNQGSTFTQNNSNLDGYLKQQFNKVAQVSHNMNQPLYSDSKKYELPSLNIKENFHNVSAPTHPHSYLNNPLFSQMNNSNVNFNKQQLPTTLVNPVNSSTMNTNNMSTAGIAGSPASNFSPTFGSPGLSGGQGSLYSFQDSSSLNNGSSNSNTINNKSSGDQNLFTSPDFFSKIQNKQVKTNTLTNDNIKTSIQNGYINDKSTNIKIQDYSSIQQKSPTQNINSSNSFNIVTNKAYTAPLSPQLINNSSSNEQHLPAVNTSSQFKTIMSNTQVHTIVETNKTDTITNNTTTNIVNGTAYTPSVHSSSSLINNTNRNTVIPQLNEQSQPQDQDQQREYVVQQYENGSRYEGQKVDGLRNGNGKFFYREGSYYQGKWKNNNMHGYGKLYYPNHKLAYEGDWFIDQFHGHGKVYNDQPTPINQCFDYTNFDNIQQKWKFYEGTLVCDSKQGFGKLVLSNNQYYEGNFQTDRVHGQGKFHNMFGDVIHGIWEDSKLVKVLDM